MSSKIAFISGHRDITEDEFKKHYQPKIADALLDNCTFVVGDCEGVDIMAQEYLESLSMDKVMVFHIGDEPMNFVESLQKTGGFRSDVDRDFAMTLISDFDLCWIREGKERSGTAQNIFRREQKNDGVSDIQEMLTIEAGMWL
jgi:hypothetical protein